jgi:hypothetical protein
MLPYLLGMWWVYLAREIARRDFGLRRSCIDVRLMTELADAVGSQDLVIVAGDPSSNVEDHDARAHVEALPVGEIDLTPRVLEAVLIPSDGRGEVHRSIDRIGDVSPKLLLRVEPGAIRS